MKEDKLNNYLKNLTKEQLEKIIIKHYEFIVSKLEHLKKENIGFKEQNMDKLVETTQQEIDFIVLQIKWYENYLYLDLVEKE